jgi:succinate dehydrogenase flavin-adding protein (antitoxin of CptAB toxin-antitoxin module)
MLRRFAGSASLSAARCSSVARRTFSPPGTAWLSAGAAKDWPSVTNSATKFDPRKFLQSEGPHSEPEVASLRRALLYRSRQTGWLETDLIMGRWAAENIDSLSVPELQEYAKIVQVLPFHIYNFICTRAHSEPIVVAGILCIRGILVHHGCYV